MAKLHLGHKGAKPRSDSSWEVAGSGLHHCLGVDSTAVPAALLGCPSAWQGVLGPWQYCLDLPKQLSYGVED